MIIDRSMLPAIVALGLLVPQGIAAQDKGFEVAFTVGAGLYEAGPTGTPLGLGGGSGASLTGAGFCDVSGALLTNFNVSGSYGAFSADLTFNHTDWPWDRWTGGVNVSTGVTDFIQRHGDSFEGVLLFRPAEAFDLGFTHRAGYTFQPLLGVGFQYTTDATGTDGAGSTPVYLAQSQTNFLLAYGFTMDVHPGSLAERGVGLRVQLLGKRALRSEAPFQTPSGLVTLDTEDANWATLSFGVVLRPGGFRGQG